MLEYWLYIFGGIWFILGCILFGFFDVDGIKGYDPLELILVWILFMCIYPILVLYEIGKWLRKRMIA